MSEKKRNYEWYVVQTYTGYEQKVEKEIISLIADEKLAVETAKQSGGDAYLLIRSVKVPMREVVGLSKSGKPVKRNEKVLPGYILVEMCLPQEADGLNGQKGWKDPCSKIRKIQGVNGFVGTKPTERPKPISDAEYNKILLQTGEVKGDKVSFIQQDYDINDKVKITEGPFATFSGTVEEILADKNKLRINVQIFGRATPVEVDVTQVEKI